MLGNSLFLVSLAIALGIGFIYFRDLGDITQIVLKVKRKNMIRFIRNEYRLPTKTYIRGINIGEDAVCYTQNFLLRAGNLINATIGGRDVVISRDSQFDSIGAWYNDSGKQILGIDFYGNSDRGVMQRVESLKPGMFWHVWVEFFPQTDINRISEDAGAD